MAETKIITVETKKDLRRFVRFPTWLYKDNKFYVHPLEREEIKFFSGDNPSFGDVILKSFIAERDGEVVGRIAVMVHKLYNEKTGGKFARFTRFDFIDDKEVSTALMNAAEDFARAQGMEVLHGPLGFSDFDKEGMLIEGFDRLSTFETIYNYAYYKNHVEELGFEKEADWLEFVIPVPTQLSERFVKISNAMVERLKLHFLPPEMSIKKVISLYADRIIEIINETYGPLHGFVPITPKLKDFMIRQFKQVIKKEYVCFVFNEENEIVAFALALPSIARSVNRSEGRLMPFGWARILREARKPKYIDMALIAVIDQYRNKGINAIMINEILKNCIKNKIVSVESNLELETNFAVQAQFEGFEKDQCKRRRCYQKKLD